VDGMLRLPSSSIKVGQDRRFPTLHTRHTRMASNSLPRRRSRERWSDRRHSRRGRQTEPGRASRARGRDRGSRLEPTPLRPHRKHVHS
jgi:hypothetical protein